ncbi:MAG: Trp biosynthesis-associated membrane protein [Janthinobacterium lividum]
MKRATLLLLGAVGAVLALAAGAPTWVSGSVRTASGTTDVLANGRDAAPVATALALVSLAAVVASTLGRRLARTIAAIVLLLGGIGVVVSSVSAFSSPGSALTGMAREASGRTNAVADDAATRPWPLVSGAGGLLVTVAGLGVLLRGGRWSSSTRYERDATTHVVVSASRTQSPSEDPAAAWDSLTHGEDPTR